MITLQNNKKYIFYKTFNNTMYTGAAHIVSIYNIIVSIYNIIVSIYNLIVSIYNIIVSIYNLIVSIYNIIFSFYNIFIYYLLLKQVQREPVGEAPPPYLDRGGQETSPTGEANGESTVTTHIDIGKEVRVFCS